MINDCLSKSLDKMHVFPARPWLQELRVRVPQTIERVFADCSSRDSIIIRVLPLLDYDREYNIQSAQIPPLTQARARQSDSNWGKKDKCEGDYPNYPVQMFTGK